MPENGNPFANVDPHQVEALVEQMRPILGGKSPELQGAALADLLAIFLCGHHPMLRDEILRLHIDAVKSLIEPNLKLLFPNGMPDGWE